MFKSFTTIRKISVIVPVPVGFRGQEVELRMHSMIASGLSPGEKKVSELGDVDGVRLTVLEDRTFKQRFSSKLG
jgi:hypothetical protein